MRSLGAGILFTEISINERVVQKVVDITTFLSLQCSLYCTELDIKIEKKRDYGTEFMIVVHFEGRTCNMAMKTNEDSLILSRYRSPGSGSMTLGTTSVWCRQEKELITKR